MTEDLVASPVPQEEVYWDEKRVLGTLERCDRFGPPMAAFLAHVHGEVSANRAADGVSVGLWHSRGLLIQGFEVKVSRKDWLRELKKPDKADRTVFRFCDRWWLVVPKARVVTRLGELPDPWGLASVDAKGVHIEKEAPELKPEPVDRPFVAELFRRAVEQLPSEKLLEKARQHGYTEGHDEGEKDAARNQESYLQVLKEKNALIKSFEDVLGQDIAGWANDDRSARVRRALEFVLKHGHEDAIRSLERVRKTTAHILQEIDEQLAKVKEPEVPP